MTPATRWPHPEYRIRLRRIMPCQILPCQLRHRWLPAARPSSIRPAPAQPPGSPFSRPVDSFMAILNIQITNASLLNIEGNIASASTTDRRISTSYLIGEMYWSFPRTDYQLGVLVPVTCSAGSALGTADLLGRLRFHARPALDRDAGLAGFCRRRADPLAFTLVPSQAAEATTANRSRGVCAVHHLRAGDRP